MMIIGGINMSLISEKVIEELSRWAEKNENVSIFPEISESESSYYIDKNAEDDYLIEYAFLNMEELKEELKKHSGLSIESQLLKKLVIEICQNRYIGRSDIYEGKGNGQEAASIRSGEKVLPEYIYVF